MRKLMLCGLLLALAIPSWAQVKNATFAHKYDVDSSTMTFCVNTGQNNDPFGEPRPGVKVGTLAPALIQTTGSSVNVTAVTSAEEPFTDLAVGDTIVVSDILHAKKELEIVTKTDAHTIVVDTAVNLTGGVPFSWMKQTCGTGLTNGWINVAGAVLVGLTSQYDQGDLDALTVRYECKTGAMGAQPVVVYPGETSDCGGGVLGTGVCEFGTPGLTGRLSVIDDAPIWAYCRIGLAYKTSDTSEVGTNLEQVTATLFKREK